jgi:DnaJ homolog subfamily C member 2
LATAAEQEIKQQPTTMSPTAEAYDSGVLPSLPTDWKGGSDENPNFKAIASLSPPVMRKLEPYGPQFLAFARRKRHGRTFSEDDRIQAQSRVKKIEDDDSGEISEPEDPLMLQRDAKDWRVRCRRFGRSSLH